MSYHILSLRNKLLLYHSFGPAHLNLHFLSHGRHAKGQKDHLLYNEMVRKSRTGNERRVDMYEDESHALEQPTCTSHRQCFAALEHEHVSIP